MIADPDVIMATLPEWERDGEIRYYHNTWGRWLSAGQASEYRDRYGVDVWDNKAGIKIYFDVYGILHIDRCRDPELKIFLEKRMTRWYWWTYKQYMSGFTTKMNVGGLIRPYTTTIKPGFYQIRYKGLTVNFDERQMDRIGEKRIEYNRKSRRYTIDTKYPRLDRILKAITDDIGKE